MVNKLCCAHFDAYCVASHRTVAFYAIGSRRAPNKCAVWMNLDLDGFRWPLTFTLHQFGIYLVRLTDIDELQWLIVFALFSRAFYSFVGFCESAINRRLLTAAFLQLTWASSLEVFKSNLKFFVWKLLQHKLIEPKLSAPNCGIERILLWWLS